MHAVTSKKVQENNIKGSEKVHIQYIGISFLENESIYMRICVKQLIK